MALPFSMCAPRSATHVLGSLRGCERLERDPQATLRELQRIAVSTLNDPQPGEYWNGWVPDPEHINALPQPLRQYIHDLETRADPAGDVAELACLRETVAALEIRVQELEEELRLGGGR